jgi:ribosomal protein L24
LKLTVAVRNLQQYTNRVARLEQRHVQFVARVLTFILHVAVYTYTIYVHFGLAEIKKKSYTKRNANNEYEQFTHTAYMIHISRAMITDKYETGTNVTRTTKKTPLTTFMKGEE